MVPFIYISGSFLSFFLGLLILSKKRKRAHDYVLGAWLFLISAHVVIFYLQELAFQVPLKWFVLNAVYPLLQGVFLYLYTGLLLQKIRLIPSLGLHFLPFFVFSISIIFLGEDVLSGLLILSVVLSGIIYITLSYRMIGGFDSFFERNNHWLKILISGLGLIWIIFITAGVLNHLFDYAPIRHEYIFLSVNVFVFAIGYFGLKEGHILQEPRVKGKYDSSPLDNEDFNNIKTLLEDIGQDKELFLNPDIKIGDLASKMKLPAHHLSQYFSASLDTTYYEYINGIRIDEVKLRIADNQLNTLSILGLALDCGFKSKATFNRAFKKQTGQTPSEYIKSLK